MKQYELIIIGAGPAGLTASIYASRYNIRHVVLGTVLGGTITLAGEVGNYPGFPSISGIELGQKFLEHAQKLGTSIESREVVAIEKVAQQYLITTNDHQQYQTKAIIIATGTKRRHLKVPGEGKYIGHGVSYCATCDAPLYRDKTVAVVGGADAACSSAVHLAQFAKKVYLIYRRDHLRAEPVWTKQIAANPHIEVIYNTNVVAILGDDQQLSAIRLDTPYQKKKELKIDGIFIEIGGIPIVDLAKDLGVQVDQDNFIITDESMATNIPGIFSAGDINTTQKEYQQVITAAAEGSIAALGVYQYLNKTAASK